MTKGSWFDEAPLFVGRSCLCVSSDLRTRDYVVKPLRNLDHLAVELGRALGRRRHLRNLHATSTAAFTSSRGYL